MRSRGPGPEIGHDATYFLIYLGGVRATNSIFLIEGRPTSRDAHLGAQHTLSFRA